MVHDLNDLEHVFILIARLRSTLEGRDIAMKPQYRYSQHHPPSPQAMPAAPRFRSRNTAAASSSSSTSSSSSASSSSSTSSLSSGGRGSLPLKDSSSATSFGAATGKLSRKEQTSAENLDRQVAALCASVPDRPVALNDIPSVRVSMLTSAFKAMDISQEGIITQLELADMLMRHGIPRSIAELQTSGYVRDQQLQYTFKMYLCI